ncbi:ERCC4 domain-containing protein [Amylocarpus encephaloides]|uniref:ERCC4 domain-containing protein n=1 Tax=Amylocarpus encephaloides TaxID=45428 RepID=A0A9P7YA92_9HELO|nr:ERCC4 domain-containing protein [Amylocarpus encephaloides]
MLEAVIDLVSSSPTRESFRPPPKIKPNQGPFMRKLAGAAAEARALLSSPHPTQSAQPKVDRGWLSLSDSDNELPRLPIVKPASKPNRTKKTTPPRTSIADDPFFLSDDFDSTVNIDNSHSLNEPSAKRRRLSLSPSPQLPGRKSRDFTRSISNIEPSKTKPPRARPAPTLKKTRILESDPIAATSSPGPFAGLAKKRKPKAIEVLGDSDSDDLPEFRPSLDIDEFSDDLPDLANIPPNYKLKLPSAKVSKNYSETKAGTKPARALKVKKPATDTKGKGKVRDSEKTSDEKAEEKAKLTAQRARDKENVAEERAGLAAQKARDKEKAAKERAAAKEAEKDKRRLEREDKAREKEVEKELAKVNNVRTDKKVSTPEMVIEFSSSLDHVLKATVRKFAGALQVDCRDWDCVQPIVKWKRKTESQWNEDLGRWEPMPMAIRPEKHILIVLTAKEFVDLATGNEETDLDCHAVRLKSKNSSCEVIYLIEGLTQWMKKNKNTKNRQFTAAVNSHLPQNGTASTTTSRGKSNKKPAGYVDEDVIEDALLRLQVVHKMLIHHTSAKIETAEWIITFTQHVSTIPYRRQKESIDTAFCMESGQVKAGDGIEDTFTKMLQENLRITASVAYGIAAKYPSVQALVKGFGREGQLALVDLRKGANRDGAVTDRRIGKSISQRLYNVFMGRDPGSWDV